MPYDFTAGGELQMERDLARERALALMFVGSVNLFDGMQH